ncbi:MAG: aminopeptidase [Planctomycetota bacterium]
MRDPRIDKLADVIVSYACRVRKDDLVSVISEPGAMPLIEAVFERVVAAGGNPFWVPKSETLDEIVLQNGNDEQLAFFNPVDMDRIEKVDVTIALWADQNTKFLGSIEPRRVALKQSARKRFMKRFLERAAAGEHRWCGTLYPTLASAQDAEMSLRDYSDFVFRAGLLHLDDPAAAWRDIHERQQLVCEYLSTKSELRFKAPARDGHDGTDLVVNVDPDKSVWINCSGGENFPDGEVFTAPQGVDGHVNYSFPAVYQGREVEGVRLEFRDGRCVDASARKNEAFLIEMLEQDQGARNLGEIAIGTNYAIENFSRNTLFDEKIGGTFHAAVGAAYPESGGTNESGLHWDMVCDLRQGGTIEADGEVFHRDGRFTDSRFPAPAS